MRLPVYVPDWQIGDRDIEWPVLGMAFEHVLLFYTDVGKPGMYCDNFGQEVTVTGIAEPLAASGSRVETAFPTAIHCSGFTLYWAAPQRTEGPLTLTGVIDASDYGTAPEGFPVVSGVVDAMELSSTSYVNNDGEGVNWEPASEGYQTFRPISVYPPYIPVAAETGLSPHTQVTGVVLHVELGSTTARGCTDGDGLNSAQSPAADGSPVRIRNFPDYANTASPCHANTVLWLFGPVSYGDACLSPGLAADMAAWEESYCASLDGNESWRSAACAAQFTATGRALAERLAQELGLDFEVEFHSYEPGSRREIFRGGLAAGNPAAADAFHGLVVAEDEERARLAALSNEPGVGWFAYAPLSGEVFNPGGGPLPEPYANPETEK